MDWLNKRIERNAPSVAGALAYGGAYLNPLLSKQDAERARTVASGVTQQAMQFTAPARDTLAQGADRLAAQGARTALQVVDRASGGLVAPPARRAAAEARALYDKTSTLAPILTVENRELSYSKDLLEGRERFSRSNLQQNPLTREQFLQQVKGPEARRLAEALDPTFLAQEGYASLAELARTRGPEASEALMGRLNRYLAEGKKPADFRRQLASEGLRDIAFPTTIEQGGKANCGAIALQQIWAREQPAQYLEALTNLGEDRPHRFATGRVLGPLNDALKNPEDGRPASVKILGDSLSLYIHEQSLARQSGLDIAHSAAEAVGRPLGITPLDNYHPEKQPQGIHNPYEMTSVLQDITGRRHKAVFLRPQTRGLEEVDRGRPVATLISGQANREWHWVQMTGRSESGLKVSSWGNEYHVGERNLEPFVRAVLVEDR